MARIVASYLDPLEAYIVCGRLRAEGIEAEIADDQTSLANWEWRQAIGGTKIRVPEAQWADARALIAELDGGGFALDAGDLEQTRPSGTAALTPDRETWSSRLAFLFGMGFGIPLPWRRTQGSDNDDDNGGARDGRLEA
jgi:Putative prokaryotic signal transducing protein